MDFELRGGKQLEKALLKLSESVEKKISVQANRAGASHYRKVLKRKITRSNKTYPDKRRGGEPQLKHLADSIGIVKDRSSKGKLIKHIVGVFGWARAYAHIREFGSKYQAPDPVFQSTMEAEAQESIRVMGKKMWEGIEKHG